MSKCLHKRWYCYDRFNNSTMMYDAPIGSQCGDCGCVQLYGGDKLYDPNAPPTDPEEWQEWRMALGL